MTTVNEKTMINNLTPHNIPSKPNIIFIMADDMGYGDLGCYGAQKIKTPNMDRIAAQGVRFTNAHSSSSVCTPSRYSVITGEYCWRSRLKSGVLWGLSPSLIEPGQETLPSILRRSGYSTAAVGKWHIGMGWKKPDGSYYETVSPGMCYGLNDINCGDGFDIDYSQRVDGGPVDVGFDYFWGIAGSLDMPPFCFIENDHTVGIPDREKSPYSPQQKRGLMTDGWRDDQVDVVFAEKTCEYIKSHVANLPKQPFFLYLTPSAPHRPCVPPDFIRGSSQAGDRGDCVQLVDWLVGKVLDTLQDENIAENTLLMVSSDNGAVATCLNGLDYGHKANGDWRGQKADIWEGGHREPFIARWPGMINPGSVCDNTVCLMDIMATCADIAGTQLPKSAAKDSISFIDSLTGKSQNGGNRDVIVHHSYHGMFAISKNGWKLILGLGSGGFTAPSYIFQEPDSPEGQLYNLKDDPREQNNLYFELPEKVFELKQELLSTFKKS